MKYSLIAVFILLSAYVSAQCGLTVSTSVTHVSCYNGTTGAVTITATGGTAPYQYQLAVGGAGAWTATNVFTGLAAGTYPASVKDAAGCVQTVYFTITQPAQLVANYTATDPTCSGSTNGAISISVTGGTTPYTYNWTKNGSFYSNSANLTGLSSGNYLLIVTDATGCTTSPIVSQQIKPITVTGFNEDVVANGTTTNIPTVCSQSIDDARGPGYGNLLYASGLTGGTKGLPSSGAFTSAQSATRTYQLGSYSASNALVLRANTDNTYGGSTSGTLAFATQHRGSYSTLYVVGTTGSGTGNINYTVNYADATTSTGTLSFQDWYLPQSNSSSFRALGDLGRVTRQNPGNIDNTGNFNLWEAPITIPGASQSKVINSITLTWSGSGSARTSIFAITGYTSTAYGIRINDGPAASVTPSVSIVSNATSNQFCAGQAVTFTATPVNGGTTPSYQWKRNGLNVGTNSASYTNSSLNNNDQIRVVMTASGGVACLTSTTATSNTITMTLSAKAASVALAASSTSICSGSTVNFTATPTNGGAAPSYQWKLNGANVGSNSPAYSNNSLSNNDQVRVVMTSNIACATGSPATSNTIALTVNGYVTPGVIISSAPASPGLNFNAVASGGGSSPAYQWYRNGTAIGGATSSTYYIASPALGDNYSLQITSSSTCATSPAAMSNYITVTAAVLPIRLEWYRVHVENKMVILNWKTSYENMADRFIIDRAPEGSSNYITVASVPASNTATGNTYSYQDGNVLNGAYTYRLTQVENDGSRKVLGFVTAAIDDAGWWIVRNVSDSWVVRSSGTLQYNLYDLQGRLLEKGRFNGEKRISKAGRNFICVLQIENEGKVSVTKLAP